MWSKFICSPRHAGRYLSSIGTAVRGKKADAVDLDVLRSFLDRLRQGPADVALLVNAVDLILGDCLAFVVQDLHRLLDHLSNEMVRRDEVVGPALRGNPRWDRTVLGRMAGSLPPGRYVSRTAHRSFDLPENLLLRWLVGNLLGAVIDIRRRVKAKGLHPDLRVLSARCEEALRHHWFGSIDEPPTLTNAMLIAARRHRRPEYRRAAALAAHRLALGSKEHDLQWRTILELLAVGWLEPIKDDNLFELYSLVLTIDVLAEELGFGEPVEYGLVAPERKHVACFDSRMGKVHVYFNQTPAVALGVTSRYSVVRDAHAGIGGQERRPDVLVRLSKPDDTIVTVLVEVKKSTDGQYLSDSVYKMFGYLHDFRDLWVTQAVGAAEAHGIVPQAVLLVPEAFRPLEEVKPGELVLLSGSDREGLVRTLRAAFA
ncbi:hypothetical protein [Azospirillum sp. INR13]|uniref:hypothetical protein n=1 Tax=Azospirillum sp. INR13 TaxID=2596919 RepID=UPI0018920BB8|nr:hypothetical protein [Azospirillum sp. INR13]